MPTDLQLTKTVSTARVEPGASVTYTLVATNNGPAAAARSP